jgi:hypothetical protein
LTSRIQLEDLPFGVDHYGVAATDRRTVLKFASLGIAAIATGILGSLGPAKRAEAAVYEYWGDCTPNQYFSDSTTVCSPSYYAAPWTIDSGGYWHKHNEWQYWGPIWCDVFYTYYLQKPTTCYGKNAWWWPQNYRSSHDVFCSDGDVTHYHGCGVDGPYFTIANSYH